MAATFTVQGQNLQIQFTYVAPTATMTEIATNAAHWLYDRRSMISAPGLKPFDQLTNAEKLDLLDKEIVRIFTMMAKEYYIQNATHAAQVTAQTSAEANLNIP